MDSLFLEVCWNSTYENFHNEKFEDYVETIYTVDNKSIETVVPHL